MITQRPIGTQVVVIADNGMFHDGDDIGKTGTIIGYTKSEFGDVLVRVRLDDSTDDSTADVVYEPSELAELNIATPAEVIDRLKDKPAGWGYEAKRRATFMPECHVTWTLDVTYRPSRDTGIMYKAVCQGVILNQFVDTDAELMLVVRESTTGTVFTIHHTQLELL